MDLSSGYIQRALPMLPTQGTRYPWLVKQDYWYDVKQLTKGAVEDEGVRFRRTTRGASLRS